MHKLSLISFLIGAVALPACIIANPPPTDSTSDPTSDPSTSGADGTGDPDDATADPDDTGESDDTGEEDDAAAETGSAGSCGWGELDDPMVDEGYLCGGEGEDPNGRFAIECPDDLEEGAECGELTGVGCCDADGNVWFCWNQAGSETLVKDEC